LKKLMNRVDDAAVESLAGLCAAHSDLIKLLPEYKTVIRADAPNAKVAVISGGGSGHEPLHCGCVGFGMLDAACAGEIFTSPAPEQICEAARAADGGRGILLLAANYTGDVMNFQMASDILRAEGFGAEQVVISDDAATRRGAAGTFLAEKIVGAGAESGIPLGELKELAERVNSNVRTMGMALTGCTVPAAGKPAFDLADDEIELGTGIQGEPGRERVKLMSSREITEYLTNAVLDGLSFNEGDEALAFVNGMGGTAFSELCTVYGDLKKILDERGIVTARGLVGNYVSSLDTRGCSVTVLKLDALTRALWDYPVQTPALRWGR
jgi:dihydroxyacetone kinase-like protein